ncbi:MAG: pantetheine-phosphate adenylyltransferase [Alphaproteobacteria bacterium]|nr:pantetheine-phosphate adenylyltransferase [Alphaproteobacteria bacterium]
MTDDKRIALYPGTFDPVTYGHLDIISRASRIVDKLVVGVARNAGKGPLYSLSERVEMVRDEVSELANRNGHGEIEVLPFGNLLIDFARSIDAKLIFRGLRAVSDFEYEFQMAGMNARIAPEVETVFLMASEKQQFVSSRLIKEIVGLGGDVQQFVPPKVLSRLTERYHREEDSSAAD